MKYTEDFLIIWQAYPIKIGKGLAAEKYRIALSQGATHEEILQGIQNYKAWLASPEWRPSPKHLATYLNQCCWEDEYELPEAAVSPEEARYRARVSVYHKTGVWKEEWGAEPKSNVLKFGA